MLRPLLVALVGACLVTTAAHAEGTQPLGSLHCPPGLGAANGQRVTVLGVVTGQYSSARGSHFTVQDATGAVTIYGNPKHCAAVGDSVRISGKVTVYNGLVEVSGNADAPLEIQTLGKARVPAPNAITPAELDAGAGADGCEPNESRLVILRRVQVRMADGTAPVAGAVFKDGTNYRLVAAGADSAASGAVMRVVDPEGCDPGHGLEGQAIPTGPVDVIGTVSQYLTRDATRGGYELLPRTREDVIAAR